VKGKSNLMVRVTGCGAATPAQVVTNEDLAKSGLDTTPEWISSRTGIEQRRVLDPATPLKSLAALAASRALANAQVDPATVDLVLLATSSPDDMFGDATSVAHAIGASKAAAFDITAACSGFLFAVVTGSQFVHSGAYKTVVVVGADALTRWVDWTDRNICVLFGDGAGAVVLRETVGPAAAPGLLGFAIHSNGADQHQLCLPYKGAARAIGNGQETTTGAYAPMTMNGREVYKFATREVPEVLLEALANAGMGAHQVDWLLLHQANIRIIEIVAQRLGIPMDRVITNLNEHGNTSAGSIPIALDAAVQSGRVKKGDVIACAGFGAGLSWGAAIIKWD
jgi:3-oxoacyl-[acyl-carrier-protein] synthase-3